MLSLPENYELWQNTLAWQPTPAQMARLQQLYTQIILANQHINLTRITEPGEFWEKHLWDSLAGILKLPELSLDSLRVIDIGTGAGFPGIPTAIIYPHWQVTLLDSTQKKINFLEALLTELELENVQTLLGRAEIVGNRSEHHGKYDLALIRAVGSAALCAQYCLPFLRHGGRAVLYRGNWTEEEEASLNSLTQKLGAKVEKIARFSTPLSGGIRHCVYLKKFS
jgi:16S rRNA (guanine527-N7)-methyltransferase